jgi:hypothetical protein
MQQMLQHISMRIMTISLEYQLHVVMLCVVKLVISMMQVAATGVWSMWSGVEHPQPHTAPRS